MLCSGALKIEAYSGQPGFKHALPDIFFFLLSLNLILPINSFRDTGVQTWTASAPLQTRHPNPR